MGKPKYIETPEELNKLFEAYREEVKSSPRIIYEFHGRDGEERAKPLERPLTIEGFRIFARKQHKSVEHYFANTDNAYDDYRTICTHIRDMIREDQITGGMVGQYNASITQRLNNLVDKQEHDIKTEQPLFGDD